MPQIVIEGFEGFRALVGAVTPPTDWLDVDQARVDAFAACTGDTQWIHVDPVRAAASEFGGTIAHGYLTLSLVSALFFGHFDVRGVGAPLNLGLDKVRFPRPLRVGTRVRARFTIAEAVDARHGLRVIIHAAIEPENSPKPVCIADQVVLYRPVA